MPSRGTAAASGRISGRAGSAATAPGGPDGL